MAIVEPKTNFLLLGTSLDASDYFLDFLGWLLSPFRLKSGARTFSDVVKDEVFLVFFFLLLCFWIGTVRASISSLVEMYFLFFFDAIFNPFLRWQDQHFLHSSSLTGEMNH